MQLMRACLLACLLMLFRVGSMQPELTTLGDWAPAEWIDEWYNKHAPATMLANPSLPADSSTVQATQKDQQASWGDDPCHIYHIPGAVIPPNTHFPPPHSSHSQAPPGPGVLKAHPQVNDGLATNTHALVGDEPIPWDLRAIIHPLPKGSKSQDPFEHLLSAWVSAQPPPVGPQFTPGSSHTSLASLPPQFLPFSDNPHLPSSKTTPQPWHQDTITLDNPYYLPAESSTAQEEHNIFRFNSHNHPTSHSEAKLMSSHTPLPHPPAQAGPGIQTAHSQNTRLDTSRSNPTGLFKHEPNPWDLQRVTNQFTIGPNSHESFDHLNSLLPSSSPQFTSHSSYTNLAGGFSHIPHVPKNAKQPSLKTKTSQSKQKNHQIIPKLQPSTKTIKKLPPHTNIRTEHSSGLYQKTDLLSQLANTEMYACQEKSLPSHAETNELTPHLGPLEFDLKMFEDVSPRDTVEHAGREIFQHQISRLPSKLLIIREKKFQVQYVNYLGWKGYIQPHPTVCSATDIRERTMIGKLLEFQGDIKLWYRRWHMITLFDFEKDPPLPHTSNEKMAKIVKYSFPLYLFYVEMICSIVPRESTTSRDLKTELKSAQESFAILSTHPSELLQSRLLKIPKEIRDRSALRILWTYLGHWMRNERPGVFKMITNSDDVAAGMKSFFNRVFAFSYSAVARKYICK